MANPYANRVNSLINTYRANPHLFNDDQLDELQELADQSGINFSPIRQEFRLRDVVEQASAGFFEGLTTIPIGEKPRTTYESIAHSLGHLAGFAPGILASPLKLAAKGVRKLGAEALGEGIEYGAQVASRNISAPMLFGDWVTQKGFEAGLKKSKMETLDFMKKGAATRSIAQQSVHLASASAMSAIWKGPDEIMNSFIYGGAAGAMFGGLGEFTAVGNLLKSNNVIHHKKAEQRIKSAIGASMLGGPAAIRGEPIEAIMYETLLGGYFGYKSRPAHEAEGGKFIQDLAYYPERDIIFRPEKHPNYKDYSKKTKEYIMDTSVEQSKTYLINQYPDISKADWDKHFRLIAEQDYGKNPTQEQINNVARQEANQHYYGNFEYVKNQFETPNPSVEDPYARQEDMDHSVEIPPKTSNLDAQKARLKDNPVFIVDVSGEMVLIQGKVGNFKGKNLGDKRVDRPLTNLQGQNFTELQYVYLPSKGLFQKGVKPLKVQMEYDKVTKTTKLVPVMKANDWFRLGNNLDRQNYYIYGGVKDKGTLTVKQYHLDYGQHSVESLIKELARTPQEARELTQSYKDSLQLEAEWYNRSIDEVRGLHDRKWVSNVLSDGTEQGLYRTGSGDLSQINRLMNTDYFIKNVVDFNKRQQLPNDKGIPLPADTFPGPLKTIILNDYIDVKSDAYKVKDSKGNIETKYNESNTDGTILFTPDKFNTMMKKMGLPTKNVSMNKPVIVWRHGNGVLQVKAAGAVADGPMLDLMKQKGVDVAIFKSAAKQTGELKSHDYWYVEGNKKYGSDFEAQDILNLDPTSIRINTNTFENPKRMYGTHFVRQFFGNLNEVQNPKVLDMVFNEYFVKSYEGTTKAKESIDKYFEGLQQGKDIELKNINIDDIPLSYIHRIYDAHFNTKAGKMLRDQIFKLEKEGKLELVDDFTQSEYRDWLARNDRMIEISEASESVVKLFKHTRNYADKVYKKYLIKRLLSPKYKYSAKSWLSPKMPHYEVKEGTFKALKDFNPTVRVGEKDMKLQELWSLYEKNPKQYQEYLKFAVIRVPADSVSGARSLIFDGYLAERGTGVVTKNNDNTYLGGADKDSDTVFLYQGLDKSIHKTLKKNSKEWQDKNDVWVDSAPSESLTGKPDPRFKTTGSKFSPSMRMIVASTAAKGNEGLGYSMTARNTMQTWIDILNKNNGELKGNVNWTTSKGSNITGTYTLKLKNNGAELRRLAREMINTSADASNYPNITDYIKWRDMMFNSAFEGTFKDTIEKTPRKITFKDLKNKTDLGVTHSLQNTLDPKGVYYNKYSKEQRGYTLGEFQSQLRNEASRLHKDSNNNYSKIAKKAVEYGLTKPLRMDAIENYHKLLVEGSKTVINASGKDRDFIRKHLTKLVRIPIFKLDKAIEKAKRTGDWEQVMEFVSNDTFLVASNNALSKKGFKIYREFIENGVKDPIKEGIFDKMLNHISDRAFKIKDRYRRLDLTETGPKDSVFKGYDKEIRDYKTQLIQAAVRNEIDPKLLTEYFDLWLISPFKPYKTYIQEGKSKGKFVLTKEPYETTSGPSRHAIQSQEITNKSWKEVLTEYENIYQNIKEKAITGQVKEPVLFSLPKDYNTPLSKPEQANTVKDLVVVNTTKQSPLKKQETLDRVYTRKALGPKDFKELETFKKNLESYSPEPNRLVNEFTLEQLGRPKDLSQLNMNDVKAMNRFFKDMDGRFGGDGIPSWVYWADPKYVDEYMWNKEKSYFQAGYNLKTASGPNKAMFKGVGTLGTLRSWFRQTNRQMDVYTDAIPDINNDKYNYRLELTPNESLAVDKGIVNKIESKNFKVEKKYTDKTYTVQNKKYTYQELVDKYSDIMSKDLEQFGNEWLFAKSKDGKSIDWKTVDEVKKWNNPLEINEYLKYDSKGRFDEMNFIKKSVIPGDRGGRVPIIHLENIYRFQYEYKLNRIVEDKGLKGQSAIKFRQDYRKKNKFEGLDRIPTGEYFPHMNFGWNKGARREIASHIEMRGEQVYKEAIAQGLSERKALQAKAGKIAELEAKWQASEAEAGGMDKHAIDDMLSRINYKELSINEIANNPKQIAFNTRPENVLSRSENLPGYDIRSSVIDTYKEKVIRAHYRNLGSVMANYRIDTMIKENPFGDFTKQQFKKFNPDPNSPLFKNWSEVWGDYLRFYVRDSFGHMTTFPERIVQSMKHGDPLKLKNTLYHGMSDQKVIKGLEWMDKRFRKLGMKMPFMADLPQITAKKGTPEYFKQVNNRKEYLSDAIHKFGKLEARYELLTLLANTGTLTANLFGGTTMTLSSAGFRNYRRARSFKWMKDNVLFDKAGNPLLTYVNNQGKKISVKTKKDLYKWVQDQGVIDNFIADELNTNVRLKSAMAKNAKASRDFMRDLRKLLKENPEVKDETVFELADRYGMKDAMLKAGGWFMQASERTLRRDSFLAHALQAKDRLGMAGRNMSLNDPYLIDAGLKGVEATQFLYHSAFRPAFMRTSLGKVATRFKLFAFQSVRTRKELLRRAKYYGYKPGTKAYENMKNLFMMDMLTLALGSLLPYSLFDTALPPPYDWLQETSELLFGDKTQRERAFFGTYPRAIAPLQIVTPPSARVVIAPIKALFNSDWDRFMDYHLHTMYPFGRILRQVDKTIYDPDAGKFEIINEQRYGTTFGRFMQQFFRLPTDKIKRLYDRAQLENEREEIIRKALGD